MSEFVYKQAFEVEPDANRFVASELKDKELRGLCAAVIHFAVHDLAIEMYKRQLGVVYHLNDKRMIDTIKFFKSELYEDYAEFIRFGLTGNQVIELIRRDPASRLDLHSRAAVERIYRDEQADMERFGAYEHAAEPDDDDYDDWIDEDDEDLEEDGDEDA